MKKQIVEFGRDSLVYGVGAMALRFISIFLTPLFTSRLAPQDYGVLAMLGLLSMVLQPIFSLSLGAVLGPMYFEEKNDATKSVAVWTTFGINVLCAALLVVLTWIMAAPLGAMVRLSAEHASDVRLVVAGVALNIVTTPWMQRVQFEKQGKTYVVITTIAALLSIIASVVTVLVLGWGVTGVLSGQIVGSGIGFAAFFAAGVRVLKPSFRLQTAKNLLRMGLPMIPSFAFLFILTQSNKYILEWQWGLSAVGVYSVGFNFGTTMSIVTGAIAAAWYPYFMSYMDREMEIRVLFGKIFTYYVYGIGFLCLLFFLAAKPVMMLLTHSAFHDGSAIVGLAALSYCLQVAFSFLLVGMYFRKEVSYISLVQGIAASISVAANYVFVRWFGAFGAGIGLAFGSLVLVAVTHAWNLRRAARYPTIEYEWRRIGIYLAGLTMLVVIDAGMTMATLAAEIIKSLIIAVIGIGILIACLNVQERKVMFSLATPAK